MSRSQAHLTVSTDPLFTRPAILLEPQIMKPLHGLNPRSILGKKWWDIERQKAYAKNNYCCWACGTYKTHVIDVEPWLDGHELYDINFEKCKYELKEIVALCRKCHSYIHFGRTTILYNEGTITEELYKIIYNYGNNVLSKAGLDTTDAWWYDPDIAQHFLPEQDGTWNKWHLIINDKRYESKFKSFEDWKAFYSSRKFESSKSRIWEDPTSSSGFGRGYSGSRSTRKK